MSDSKTLLVIKGEKPRREDWWPLLVAAVKEDYKYGFDELLELTSRIDQQDSRGCTALHWSMKIAVEKGNLYYAEKLVGVGANLEIRNDDGLTAWDLVKDYEISRKLRFVQPASAKDNHGSEYNKMLQLEKMAQSLSPESQIVLGLLLTAQQLPAGIRHHLGHRLLGQAQKSNEANQNQ